MNFITTTDLHTLIDASVLTEITSNTASKLDEAELMATSTVEDYISQDYDTHAAFGKEGTERHKMLVMVMCDLMLFHLHSPLNGRNIPELRQKRYDDAMKWLTQVKDGKLVPKGLPVKEDDPDEENAGEWGLWSSEKFNSDY